MRYGRIRLACDDDDDENSACWLNTNSISNTYLGKPRRYWMYWMFDLLTISMYNLEDDSV